MAERVTVPLSEVAHQLSKAAKCLVDTAEAKTPQEKFDLLLIARRKVGSAYNMLGNNIETINLLGDKGGA